MRGEGDCLHGDDDNPGHVLTVFCSSQGTVFKDRSHTQHIQCMVNLYQMHR